MLVTKDIAHAQVPRRLGIGLVPIVLIVGLMAFQTGCSAAAVLRGRIDGLSDIIAQARRNGAYHCAPQELAVAEAHSDFATTELAQGNLARAQEHFRLAEPNGRAALRLSPPDRCAPLSEPPPPAPAEEPPPPPPAPGDRDGDGILDPEDECPDQPEDIDAHEDEDGCPEEADRDGDGINDSVDACPLEPEDVDEYQDQDGCPEVDNDLDMIADAADRCPLEPEDPDGFEDTDGCPDPDNDQDSVSDVDDQCPNETGPPAEQGCPRVYEDVEVTSTGIVIRQRIYFETNRAVIRPVSFGILNTVAQVLVDFPDISLEIQGHTDSRGRDAHNLTLSQERAQSVVTYLVAQGTAAERMRAQGYGETQPVDSNRTRDGRANNRRVEFHRTDAVARAAQEAAVP